jgi:hypothetical protein
MEIIEDITETLESLSQRFQEREQCNSAFPFPSYLKVIGEVLTTLNGVNNKLINNKKIREISKELLDMIRNFNKLCKSIFNEAKIIHRNLGSNTIQFNILKRILNSESPLTKQGIDDGNCAVDILKRNIKEMEKIEENLKVNMAAQSKLLDLKLKIEQKKQKYNNRLEHLEFNSLKYIFGGAAVGTAASGIASIIALFTEGFLGDSGTLMVAGCCVNPRIAIVTAALGVGLLASIGTLSATQYLKDSSRENIEKLKKLDSNAEKLLMKMEELDSLLNDSYAEKRIIKDYTIQQLEDCLKNETQRQENRGICDKMFEENEKLVNLFSQLKEISCKT